MFAYVQASLIIFNIYTFTVDTWWVCWCLRRLFTSNWNREPAFHHFQPFPGSLRDLAFVETDLLVQITSITGVVLRGKREMMTRGWLKSIESWNCSKVFFLFWFVLFSSRLHRFHRFQVSTTKGPGWNIGSCKFICLASPRVQRLHSSGHRSSRSGMRRSLGVFLGSYICHIVVNSTSTIHKWQLFIHNMDVRRYSSSLSLIPLLGPLCRWSDQPEDSLPVADPAADPVSWGPSIFNIELKPEVQTAVGAYRGLPWRSLELGSVAVVRC